MCVFVLNQIPSYILFIFVTDEKTDKECKSYTRILKKLFGDSEKNEIREY